MAVSFKIPDESTLVDRQFFQIPLADGVLAGYQYDAQTKTLFAKESQILIPEFHGSTHVATDPVPEATTDLRGLMSSDDKVKLDSLLQTRIGILGFQGAGYPDDGGFLQGDITLAAGSEFISLERIGNTVRFTVDTPQFFNCNCEECAQIFWIIDESEPSSIRPPSCNGKMPGVNAYGELKIYALPESSILDPSNPLDLLNTKGDFPSLIFKRYDDGQTPNEAELDIVLKRNSDLTSHTGWSMTPGASGVIETVWFTGKDSDGEQLRFELLPELQPGLLGALLYKGHTLTRQMAVVTNFTPDILSTNQYKVRKWDVLNAKVIGDELTATNIWKYDNAENETTDLTAPKQLVLDATKSLLELGTLVQLWEFQIGEVNGQRITKTFFNKEPALLASSIWSLSAAVAFGDLVSQREDTDSAATLLTASVITSSDVRIFERTVWGLTTFEDRLILSDDGTQNTTSGLYEPSGVPINNLFVADVDSSIPGLKVSEIPQPIVGDVNGDGDVDQDDLDLLTASFGLSSGDPGFNSDADLNNDGVVDVRDLALIGANFDISVNQTQERPVFLWHRGNHKNVYIKALIGMPDADNSQTFPPFDILLAAPVDSFDDTYMKVIKRDTFLTGPFAGAPYIVVKGPQWDQVPQSGVLRVLSGAFRNTLWRYQFKAAFSILDDDAITLIGVDETYPFDEDFPVGTDFTSGDASIPNATSVAELLHADFTSPCVRLEFSVNDTTDAEAVQLQTKVGTLDMTLPYELNKGSTIKDDLVRGLRPGFSVSKVHTQDGFITDGVGTGVSGDPSGFKVFSGGELPAPIDGDIEKWNELEIMRRDDQVWLWWNGLILAPDAEASLNLDDPVVVNTPYFPIVPDLEFGKIAFRLWPGAVIRQVEIRDQNFAFNEFTRSQLEIVS